MPMEVTITFTSITHIQAGFMGIKKKAMEDTAQIMAAQPKALRFDPTHFVNAGDTPPNIMQVTSPNIMNLV